MGERVPERTDTPRTRPVAAIAEARFRHPGYEAFRLIVRETVVTAAPLYCSKIASLNAGVRDPSIAETAAMRQGQ